MSKACSGETKKPRRRCPTFDRSRRRRLGFAGRDIRDQIRLGSRGSGTEVSRLASKPLRNRELTPCGSGVR